MIFLFAAHCTVDVKRLDSLAVGAFYLFGELHTSHSIYIISFILSLHTNLIINAAKEILVLCSCQLATA